jgi:hypothetical protein
MANSRTSRIVQSVLGLAALWAGGCGGTFTTGPGDGGGGGPSGAGGDGSGGKGTCAGEAACGLVFGCGEGSISVIKPGDCCPSCEPVGSGGASAGSGGGTSSGGSVGVAGSSGSGGHCGAVNCPAIFCNGLLVSTPGQCCPICQPGSGGAGGGANCSNVACPGFACAQGYHSVVEPGQCCPTCVPDADACSQGKQGYAALLSTLLNQSESESCQVDADCTLLSGDASCGQACSATPVSTVVASEFNAKLSAYAKSNCSTCMVTYPPCAAPPPPVCVGGICMAYHPL